MGFLPDKHNLQQQGVQKAPTQRGDKVFEMTPPSKGAVRLQGFESLADSHSHSAPDGVMRRRELTMASNKHPFGNGARRESHVVEHQMDIALGEFQRISSIPMRGDHEPYEGPPLRSAHFNSNRVVGCIAATNELVVL